jgi:hypothetical protein
VPRPLTFIVAWLIAGAMVYVARRPRWGPVARIWWWAGACMAISLAFAFTVGPLVRFP